MGLKIWVGGRWYKDKEFELFLEKLSEEEKQKLSKKRSYFNGKVWIFGESWFEVYKTLFEGKGISEETVRWASEEVEYSDLERRYLTNFEILTCKLFNQGFVAKKVSDPDEKENKFEGIEKIEMKYNVQKIYPYLKELEKAIPNLLRIIPAVEKW
jgi:hypothetical protein